MKYSSICHALFLIDSKAKRKRADLYRFGIFRVIYPRHPGCTTSLGSKKFSCHTFAAMKSGNDDLLTRWWALEARLAERFGKKPDMETILFLIGIQEFGRIKQKFTKEQKQDLMHIAVCSLLSQSGYYVIESYDNEGWPHFKQLKALPVMDMIEQENFLKDHILLYFTSHDFV